MRLVYIDENGNEIPVSGRPTSAENLPIAPGSSTSTAEAITTLQNRENIKIRQTQVNIPAVSVTSEQESILLQNVDIRTLQHNALDDISGMTETLIGAVFLWCSGAAGIPIDTLVQNGNVSLRVRGLYNNSVTAVRLLTFWE